MFAEEINKRKVRNNNIKGEASYTACIDKS